MEAILYLRTKFPQVAERRDGCRLEHQVVGASIIAKGFGEHLSKKGWKAGVVDGTGAAVKLGSFEGASHR